MELEADKGTTAEAEAEREAANGNEKKKDVRRYYCEYCGISRSKKCLMTSHILSAHKEEAAKAEVNREKEKQMEEERNRCKECGIWFKKPAHLKQHMASHSSEVLFTFNINVLNRCEALDPIKNSKMRRGIYLRYLERTSSRTG